MEIWKYQGVGNDFVLVEGETDEGAWPQVAEGMCARHWGVGADGLLVVLPSGTAAARMRMFNPDGTEDMCGNGLRCVALHLAERGRAAGAFEVETLSGLRQVEIVERGPGWAQVRAGMGRADLRPDAIPARLAGDRAVDVEVPVADETLRLTPLSTGTAHAVLFGDRPDDARFFRLSPLVEHHALFPERTTVLWATVAGPDRLSLRIWERGVGETLACGTGACAAAVAAYLKGLVGREVRVESPGGTLEVGIGGDLSLTLTGPAVRVFRGDWPE